MSIIIASGDQISKSPINNSTAKMMYSFPKDKRFQPLGEKSACSTFYYKLPPVLSKRSASIGYGTKSDFTKEKKDAKAPYYDHATDFDTKKPRSPAFTFGISRAYYNKVFLETAKMFDKNVPGPGKYNYLKSIGDESSKWTMRGKGESKNLGSKNRVPGPGDYPPIALKLDGKYPLSSFRNTVNIVWGHSKATRFPPQCNIIFYLFNRQ